MPYDAFTIDTSIIDQNGLNFEGGLLAQLDQFKTGPIDFILSEIVVRETLRHLQTNGKRARDAALNALTKATQSHLITPDAAKTAVEAIGDSRDIANSKVASFIEATGAEVVPANLCTIEALLKAYFSPTAPFEASSDKKHEFPDALALMSLEQWAKSAGKTVLAASADKGWKTFADTSDYIFVKTDLADALGVVQEHAEIADARVNELLGAIDADDMKHLRSSIHSHLADALVSWDFDIEAHSAHRFDTDTTELILEEFRFVGDDGDHGITIVRLGSSETVVRVDVDVTATARADFSLYVWDSVDREEIGMGSTSAESEADFEATVLITILGDLDGPANELDIDDVELVEGSLSVDMGEIEIDYGDRDDYADYDQLQLMLGSEPSTGTAAAHPDVGEGSDTPF